MIWILNMIVSVNLRRVSHGISANDGLIFPTFGIIYSNFKLLTDVQFYSSVQFIPSAQMWEI